MSGVGMWYQACCHCCELTCQIKEIKLAPVRVKADWPRGSIQALWLKEKV